MTTKRFAIVVILAALTAFPATSLRAQSGERAPETKEYVDQAIAETLDLLERMKGGQAHHLEGSWDVTITPVVPPGVPQPPSFLAHATIARGGAFIGSDRTRPFDGPQHGTWAHLMVRPRRCCRLGAPARWYDRLSPARFPR